MIIPAEIDQARERGEQLSDEDVFDAFVALGLSRESAEFYLALRRGELVDLPFPVR